MPETKEIDLTEVIEILIDIRARQAAILKLIRGMGTQSRDNMDVAQIEALERIRKLPEVQAALSKSSLPPRGQLARALKSFHWES